GGADQGGAQQRGAGFGHGLALAVGFAGFGGFGGQAGEGAEPLAVGEPGWVAHACGQGGPANVGQAGQGAGEGGGGHLLGAGLARGGVGGESGLEPLQEAVFGGDLGGQAGEVDGGVAAVEIQGGGGGVPPLAGALGALMVVRGLGDQRGQPRCAQFEQ